MHKAIRNIRLPADYLDYLNKGNRSAYLTRLLRGISAQVLVDGLVARYEGRAPDMGGATRVTSVSLDQDAADLLQDLALRTKLSQPDVICLAIDAALASSMTSPAPATSVNDDHSDDHSHDHSDIVDLIPLIR